jgi:hypothetical protein
MPFPPDVVALQLLPIKVETESDNLFDLRASECSNSAPLFAALLRIREPFRSTVRFLCRMYTFSLLIIFQPVQPSQ